jgi:hypothetical protein
MLMYGCRKKSVPPAWALNEVLTNPHCKNGRATVQIHFSRAWTDKLAKSKQWKRDVRFGYMECKQPVQVSGSYVTVASKLGRYKLDLVGIHEVSWAKGEAVRAGDYIFSM